MKINEQHLKIGDKVTYNGLGGDREGVIIKRRKSTKNLSYLTIKLKHSTLNMKFCKGCPISDIGISLNS